ncbi:hypothetical protein [Phormidium pseudopriestleyi]|nr:hypothetical protein [Phormidium pseudopriestleyi]
MTWDSCTTDRLASPPGENHDSLKQQARLKPLAYEFDSDWLEEE